MKGKLLVILLSIACVFCIAFGFTACSEKDDGAHSGTEQGGANTPDDKGEQTPDPDSGNNNKPAEPKQVFTVTLNVRNSDGQLIEYSPDSHDITAHLSGKNDNYKATFNEDGVAKISASEGAYRVTLSNLPSDYTYDPNGIYVDNDFRDVTIELLNVIPTQGTGKGLYVQDGTCIPLTDIGTYRATVEKRHSIFSAKEATDGSVVYFQFIPAQPGYYSLESMVDVEGKKINPIVDIFTGTSTYKFFSETIDGGGTAGEYTKNFKWEGVVHGGYQGSGYTFGIKAQVAYDVQWPVDIYFKLTYIAPEENFDDGLIYQLNDDGLSYSVVGYNSTDAEVIIPQTHNELPVTSIGYRAFQNCTSLKSITIPDSVTEIGELAFCDCTSLKSITIPNSVRYMGIGILANCQENIKTISLPYIGAFRYNDPPENIFTHEEGGSTVDITDPTTYGHFGYLFGAESIKRNIAFTWGMLSDVTVIVTDSSPICHGAFFEVYGVTAVIIKEGMTEIMEQGFASMYNLETLVLPKSIKTVGDSALSGISTLQTIYFGGTEAEWNEISISPENFTIYYYSEMQQNDCWHYDDNGLPKLW